MSPVQSRRCEKKRRNSARKVVNRWVLSYIPMMGTTQQPKKKPKISPDRVADILVSNNVDLGEDKIALVLIRGYYLDTMGKPGTNDFGIYDDAVVLVGTDGLFATFNGNSDPSQYTGNIAQIRPGVYRYKLGIHGLSKPPDRRYPALVQAEKVSVKRANGRVSSGFYGINIHRGGESSTSSLGCVTIVPAQWPGFFSQVKGEMQSRLVNTIPVVLVDEETDRKRVSRT